MWESVREWTPTLPSEFSFGELKSQWIPESSKSDCRGQNPLDWKFHYIIENLLECRCLKWAHMTHLGSWNISYGQKKLLAIWLPSTKSQESPQFFCMQVTCYILFKNSQQGLQLCFRPHLKWRFAQEVTGFGSVESPNFENFKTLNLGILGQNDIWVLTLWPSTKSTIRGKVMTSPKFGPWRVLWVCVCLWFIRAPKCSNCTLTNLLFGLCRSMWIINLLVNLSSPHPEAPARPSTPKCYEPKNVPQLIFLSLSSPLDSQLSPSRSLGMHH